ncbi:MAG: OmpA family protein [candidate division WOR-3 bacterium]|jgi:peptidoglycan-associated lipoprotein
MKTAVKITTLFMGILVILAVGGCPKKCVKPVTEEPVVVEEPVEEKPVAEPPKLSLNLQTIYFDFDKSDIRPGDAQILQQNAEQIKQALNQNQKFTVMIEGHCCPIGTAEYNMALGQRRAEAAKAYLVKLGVDGTILNTISYGEERLVTTDPAQYHLNRRCEFKTEQK